jgi:hypothetical protein
MKNILYYFVQFGSHASRTPPNCWNVTYVTELLAGCRNHLGIQKKTPNFFPVAYGAMRVKTGTQREILKFDILGTSSASLAHIFSLRYSTVPKKSRRHGRFGGLPKSKFRQACHASQGLLNWMKWYSKYGLISLAVIEQLKLVQYDKQKYWFIGLATI